MSAPAVLIGEIEIPMSAKSVGQPADHRLIDGRKALDRGAWPEACDLFREALSSDETPEALEGLGEAAWWLEDAETLLDAQERAYLLYRRRGDLRAAGRMATALAFDYAIFRMELAVSHGWLQRAHRYLDEQTPVREQVWLALVEAEMCYHVERDMESVRSLARGAKDMARDLGLLDLEMFGQALEGLALVGLGEVREGLACLDEATAAVVTGEVENLRAVAATCCVMVWACERIRDVDRASQWCDHAIAFCGRHGLRGFLGTCRAHYASVLTARGEWEEAEAQLAKARELLQPRPAWSLSAIERLAELRRRQGRLSEAEELLDELGPLPAAIVGKARVCLDRGELQAAQDLCERALRRLSDTDRTDRLGPLEILLRIHCARGEAAAARPVLADLEAIAAAAGTEPAHATMSHARGLVALADAAAADARRCLEDALDLYERHSMPFEAGLARVDLASALEQLGRRPDALSELRAATRAFSDLGASVAESSAAGLAAELTTVSPHAGGPLSPRETEVLELLNQGLSNAEIAEALVLSVHTIRRHVSNILTKLGVASRAAAAAYAREHGLI